MHPKSVQMMTQPKASNGGRDSVRNGKSVAPMGMKYSATIPETKCGPTELAPSSATSLSVASPEVSNLKRDTLCVSFVDVVKFSTLMHANEEDAFRRWTELREDLIVPLIQQFGGTLIKSTGDGLLVTFPDPAEGVRWSREVQTQARRRRQSLALRVSLNYCPVLRDGDDLLGDGVNIAARLQEHVSSGGVILTQAVQNQISGLADIEANPLGPIRLRNINGVVDAYELLTDARNLSKSARESARLPSIAVMPFANLGDDENDAYFAAGIIEDVIVSLSGQRDLTVISRSSTLSFAHQTVDLRTVASVLDVMYLITGTLRRSGKRIIISTALVSAETGQQLASLRRDFTEGEMFQVQDEIVEMILTQLVPGMLSAERQRVLRKWPGSFTAYDNYLRALDLIGSLERETFDEAGVHLTRAIAGDPGFSMALAWAARWHSLRVGQGWSEDSKRDALEAADLAMQAIRLDQQNALALAVYGHVQSYLFGDFEKAISYFDRAQVLNPSGSTVWLLSSVTLASVGRADEGIEAAERALRLSPFDQRLFVNYAFLGTAHYGAGHYRRAIKWLMRCLIENPRYTSALRTLAVTQVALGQLAQARETMGRLLEFEPGFSLAAYRRAHRLYSDPDQAEIFYDRLHHAGAPD